jgi:hypothetical protein
MEDLPQATLTFNDSKGMLHFGAEVGLCHLNQIHKPALSCLWKYSALAGLHGNPELSLTVLAIATFLVANGFRAAVADVTCNCFAEACGYAVDRRSSP